MGYKDGVYLEKIT